MYPNLVRGQIQSIPAILADTLYMANNGTTLAKRVFAIVRYNTLSS